MRFSGLLPGGYCGQPENLRQQGRCHLPIFQLVDVLDNGKAIVGGVFHAGCVRNPIDFPASWCVALGLPFMLTPEFRLGKRGGGGGRGTAKSGVRSIFRRKFAE